MSRTSLNRAWDTASRSRRAQAGEAGLADCSGLAGLVSTELPEKVRELVDIVIDLQTANDIPSDVIYEVFSELHMGDAHPDDLRKLYDERRVNAIEQLCKTLPSAIKRLQDTTLVEVLELMYTIEGLKVAVGKAEAIKAATANNDIFLYDAVSSDRREKLDYYVWPKYRAGTISRLKDEWTHAKTKLEDLKKIEDEKPN
eukprot:TRINITY_DN17380_c0_g1_i1.p1 TRINITY_DN17380_c0_g1~~TRINITY_DN17380_c0_g1_i1.p1  ORF type:complete len:199 (+),score=13.21 TRINITY_DN17380_c0_g1_i1:117-713(+)